MMNFASLEKSTIWKIIASVLHIGNINFDDKSFDDDAGCLIVNQQNLKSVAALLNINYESLAEALVTKYRVIANQQIKSKLSKVDCCSLRLKFIQIFLNFFLIY